MSRELLVLTQRRKEQRTIEVGGLVVQRELAHKLRRKRLVGRELLLELGVGVAHVRVELEDGLDRAADGEALREVDKLLEALDKGVATRKGSGSGQRSRLFSQDCEKLY